MFLSVLSYILQGVDIMTNKTVKKGAAYIRVSTDRQEELSPDAQKRLILEYAHKNQILIPPENIYFEQGISGRFVSKRPAFQTMIGRAKSKEHPFDIILVWKFSRFARNQEESIVYKSMLQKDHVEVVSISEPVIDGPFGSLIERIIEWMDEYYSIRLSGEVHRGMTEKALRGGYQSLPPYGYIFEKNAPPRINPSQASVIRHIYREYLSGKSLTNISRDLNSLGICTAKGNSFEPRTVKYILENPFYYGKIRWNYTKRGGKRKQPDEWIITQGRHEPLISESDWLSVQSLIKKENLSPGPRDITSCRHWLSGILKCSSCGSSLSYNSCGKYFQCWKYGKGMCSISHSVSAKVIESNVIAGLKASVFSCGLKYQTEVLPSPEFQEEEKEILLEQYKKHLVKERRIQEAYESGIDTLEDYAANKNRLKEEKEILKDKIRSLSSPRNFYRKKGAIHSITSAAELLSDPNTDYEIKGKVLRSVTEKIVYDKVNGNLVFFFYLEN